MYSQSSCLLVGWVALSVRERHLHQLSWCVWEAFRCAMYIFTEDVKMAPYESCDQHDKAASVNVLPLCNCGCTILVEVLTIFTKVKVLILQCKNTLYQLQALQEKCYLSQAWKHNQHKLKYQLCFFCSPFHSGCFTGSCVWKIWNLKKMKKLLSHRKHCLVSSPAFTSMTFWHHRVTMSHICSMRTLVCFLSMKAWKLVLVVTSDNIMNLKSRNTRCKNMSLVIVLHTVTCIIRLILLMLLKVSWGGTTLSIICCVKILKCRHNSAVTVLTFYLQWNIWKIWILSSMFKTTA